MLRDHDQQDQQLRRNQQIVELPKMPGFSIPRGATSGGRVALPPRAPLLRIRRTSSGALRSRLARAEDFQAVSETERLIAKTTAMHKECSRRQALRAAENSRRRAREGSGVEESRGGPPSPLFIFSLLPHLGCALATLRMVDEWTSDLGPALMEGLEGMSEVDRLCLKVEAIHKENSRQQMLGFDDITRRRARETAEANASPKMPRSKFMWLPNFEGALVGLREVDELEAELQAAPVEDLEKMSEGNRVSSKVAANRKKNSKRQERQGVENLRRREREAAGSDPDARAQLLHASSAMPESPQWVPVPGSQQLVFDGSRYFDARVKSTDIPPLPEHV